jgi:hypothetical protein
MNACATFARGKHLTFQRYERIYPLVALVFCHFPTPIPRFFFVITRMLLHISYIDFYFILLAFLHFHVKIGKGNFGSALVHHTSLLVLNGGFLVGILWRNFDPHLHCPLTFVMS